MKKILSLVLAVVLVLTLSCAALAEGYSGDLKVWVADAAVDFTNQQVEAFKAANPDFADMTVTVEAVGEGEARATPPARLSPTWTPLPTSLASPRTSWPAWWPPARWRSWSPPTPRP